MAEKDEFLKKQKEKLLVERKRIEEEMHALFEEESEDYSQEHTGELSMYDNHPADVASDTFEREKNEALLHNARQTLKLIDMALRKIEHGTYTICEECGQEIPRERLEVLPFAITCISCQERDERRSK